MRGKARLVDVRAGERNDDGADLLAELLVRYADHRRLGHPRMSLETVLDLDRVDVLAAAQDEVGAPGGQVEKPVPELPKVAAVQPSAAVDDGTRRLVVAPVAEHDEWPADADLARVGKDPHLDRRRRAADGL